MADNRYQVVAECAYVKIADAAGVSWRLLEKGALIFGDDTPNLDHLIQNGYVVKVGDDATGGVDANGAPSGVTPTPDEQDAADRAKADADLEEKRAAAKAKLPADGSAPDGRLGQPVWVEYLVSKGSNYDDVKDVDKDQLVALAKQQS